MHFEFATATRIVFGPGRLNEVGTLAKAFGQRALLVTGKGKERAARLIEILAREQIETIGFQVTGEPKLKEISQGVTVAKAEGCDQVIGFGGGSALDAGKAIAGLLTNPGELMDYVEVIGRTQPLAYPAAPCLAIPTTAGTGAEVTRNAVLASPEHKFKVSLRSPYLLPKVALVDPELTYDLPPALTATTGLDALTQVIEPYVSLRANALTDGFCREGMRRVARSLRRAYAEPHDAAAREDMALASLLSGLSLANAALGAVHGFAAPLGGMYAGPHGGFCAAVLPWASEVNVRALRQRQTGGEGLRRYTDATRILTGNPSAKPEDLGGWLRELCLTLQAPSLRAYGVPREGFHELIEKASRASSMKGNPIVLTTEELQEILEKSWR
jgi:alcohol dehydrogenase class IV